MEELKAASPSLRFFIEITNHHYQAAVMLQFISVVILTIIVYRLGFAKKLPLLQNIIIYTCLIVGCLVLLLFSYTLPITEALFAAAVLLILYKVRLRQTKKQETEAK